MTQDNLTKEQKEFLELCGEALDNQEQMKEMRVAFHNLKGKKL